MKTFHFQNNFTTISAVAVLVFIFTFAGCSSIKTFANNFGGSTAADANSQSAAPEAAATPDRLQAARCQKVLGGDRRNKPNDRGEVPADMPLPRGSVLCGYIDGQGATYYINDAMDKGAMAQFFRDVLPPQDFPLKLDNPQNGGRFMVFVRGTSETLQIETALSSSGEEYKNIFSIAYMPPRDDHGNEVTGTTIMRRAGNSNVSTDTQRPDTQNGNRQNTADCGDHPVGSMDCAATKNPTNRQFSLEIVNPDGSRRTYVGERIQRGREAIILHVTISGSSAESNGEWWDKLSGDGRTTDAQNTFRKVDGVWTRQRRKPAEQEYQNLVIATNVIQFADVAAARATLIGTGAVNGENCNHYQLKYDNTGANVTDYWISLRTGYALRRQTKVNNQTTIVNESRQDENIRIETPPGGE
jgi:hypothetical protein